MKWINVLLFGCVSVAILGVSAADIRRSGSSPMTRAVSLFSPTHKANKYYHKYSAALAAVDCLRQQCELEMKRSFDGLSYLYHCIRGTVPCSTVVAELIHEMIVWVGTDISPDNGKLRAQNKVCDAACSRYEDKIEDAVQ
jgi:hypothetical protein